jgi:hypothetical protein
MADTNILHCNETDPTDLTLIIELKDIKASKAIRVTHLEKIMTDNEQVLLESQTARSSQLAQLEDRAEELLSKAKALHFNVWQGNGIATTEQVAGFYEVPIKTIETVLQRNREEFNSDELRTITSKELKELKAQTLTMKVCQITEELKPHSGFDLGRYTKSLLVWNPRATLRLGYLLRDSPIAKAVRTTSLDFIEQAAKPKAASPKSQAEITLALAQQQVDQEQRMQAVEARVNQIEQRSIDAIEAINLLPVPTESAPPLTERASLRQLINKWCDATNVDQHLAWTKLYTELYYRDGFSVNARMKKDKYATKLDLIVDCGKLSVLYAIAQDIFGSSKGGVKCVD